MKFMTATECIEREKAWDAEMERRGQELQKEVDKVVEVFVAHAFKVMKENGWI